jgi:hypothetical protein
VKIEKEDGNIASLPVAKLAEMLNFRLAHIMASEVDPNYKSILADHLLYPDLWATEVPKEKLSLEGAIVPSQQTIDTYLAELDNNRVPNWVRQHLEPLLPLWKS